MLLSTTLPAGTILSVVGLQVKFQEYVELSHSFLGACIEQGSSDTLPVVRNSSLFCMDYAILLQGWVRCTFGRDRVARLVRLPLPSTA